MVDRLLECHDGPELGQSRILGHFVAPRQRRLCVVVKGPEVVRHRHLIVEEVLDSVNRAGTW